MDNSKDNDSFRAAVSDIKPLQVDRTPPVSAKPPPVARFTRMDQQAVLNESLHDDSMRLDNGDETQFCRVGIKHPVFIKLRKGRYTVDEELDLHGLTVTEAKQVLRSFIREANMQRWSCVRIIHGKGNRSAQGIAVLRPKVFKWLTQTDAVVAFCSAKQKHGGTGALYVLLTG